MAQAKAKKEGKTDKGKGGKKGTKAFALENGIKTMGDVKLGMKTTGRVHKVHDDHLIVILGPKVPGRLHISQVADASTPKEGGAFDGPSRAQSAPRSLRRALVTATGQSRVTPSLR